MQGWQFGIDELLRVIYNHGAQAPWCNTKTPRFATIGT